MFPNLPGSGPVRVPAQGDFAMDENRIGDRPQSAKPGRNYGIDLLKVIAMLMVICGHLLVHGGGYAGSSPLTLRFEAVSVIHAFTFSCVDVYVMLAGFLHQNRRTRPEAPIGLWFTAVFYSVLCPAVLKLCGVEIGVSDILKGFLPVTTEQSWFFSAFFVLFFLMPALNRVVEDRRLARVTLAGALFCFSLLPILARNVELFGLSGGYSLLWFMVLYLCGACLGRWGPPAWLTQRRAVLLFVLSLLLTVFAGNLLYLLRDTPVGRIWPRNFFYNHTSPAVLLCSACLVCIFSRTEVRSEKLRRALQTLASCTFGVYLLHDNLFVRDLLITGRFATLSEQPVPKILLVLLTWTLAILAVGTAVDLLRDRLFRALGVPRLAKRIARLAESCFAKLFP